MARLSQEALKVLNVHLDEIERECPDLKFDRSAETLEAEWVEMSFAKAADVFLGNNATEQEGLDYLCDDTIVAGQFVSDNVQFVVFQEF